jgi:hypothetical protein
MVAPHHRGRMGAPVRDRPAPVAPTPVRHRAGVAVPSRYLAHHILGRRRLAPDAGKVEEGERGLFCFAAIREAPRAEQPGVDDLPFVPAPVLEIQKRRLCILQFEKEL